MLQCFRNLYCKSIQNKVDNKIYIVKLCIKITQNRKLWLMLTKSDENRFTRQINIVIYSNKNVKSFTWRSSQDV